MKISDNGLAIVMAFEGCHKAVPGKPGFYKAYLDPVGIPTIGWGHTNVHPPKFNADTIWSQAQCDNALRSDLAGFEKHVLTQLKPSVKLAQHEFDALVSWAYNTGGPASATLWRKLNAGDRAGIPAELAKWNKAGGKVLAGLVRRRKAEGLLFAGDIVEALKVAGAKKPPSAPQPKPAVIPPPPDVEPVEPAPSSGWLAALFSAIAAIFRRKD